MRLQLCGEGNSPAACDVPQHCTRKTFVFQFRRLANSITACIGAGLGLTSTTQLSTMLRRLMWRDTNKRLVNKQRGSISQTTGLSRGNFQRRCAAGFVILEKFHMSD